MIFSPFIICFTANSTIFPLFVLGISGTLIIIAGTCLGEQFFLILDLINLIKTQTFHIRFLSEEYRDRDFTGKQYCIDNGIELFFHLRRHQYSSTELRNRVYKLEKIKREEKVGEVMEQYSPKLLNKYIDNESK